MSDIEATRLLDAAKQALEALEANDKLINGEENCFGLEGAMDGYYRGCFDVDGVNKLTDQAITSLRQAIASAEHVEAEAKSLQQEPVAWLGEDDMKAMTDLEKQSWIQAGRSELVETYNKPLYITTQSQKPLTDEQIDEATQKWAGHTMVSLDRLIMCREYARAIEAAHNIKGEA